MFLCISRRCLYIIIIDDRYQEIPGQKLIRVCQLPAQTFRQAWWPITSVTNTDGYSINSFDWISTVKHCHHCWRLTMRSAKFAFKFIPPKFATDGPSTDPLVPLLELEKACLFFGKPDYPELPSSGGLFKESLDVRNPDKPNWTTIYMSIIQSGIFFNSWNHSRQGFNLEALGILSSTAKY